MNYLRGAALLTWTDTGHIGAGSIVDDSGGGGSLVWTWSGTIPCRVDAMGGGESMAGERISDRSTHTIQCPPDTPVTADNRFWIDGRGTFEITAIVDRTLQTVMEFEAVKAS